MKIVQFSNGKYGVLLTDDPSASEFWKARFQDKYWPTMSYKMDSEYFASGCFIDTLEEAKKVAGIKEKPLTYKILESI